MNLSSKESITLSGNKDIKFQTKFDFLHRSLYFHQIIKENARSKHYIAEDITNLDSPSQPIFYYVKQVFYSTQKESQYAGIYYTKFSEYCKSHFAKTEISKLVKMHHFEDPVKNIFEMVLLFEYGDSDRVDVEVIEPEQILRFMKNICILLNHVYKFNQLTHNNLNLKNIVLCNNELKISGFKPIYVEKEPKSWKQQIYKQYGFLRLDFFCIGLIWLNFLNVPISQYLSKDRPIDKIQADLLKLLPSIKNLRKSEMLESLLNLQHKPAIEMENVLLQFDEYFILEKISMAKESRGTGFEGQNNSFAPHSIDKQNEQNSRISNNFSSEDRDTKMSARDDNNLFKKSFKESEKGLSTEHDRLSGENAHHSNLNSQIKGHSDMILNDQFSVVQKDINDGNMKHSKLSYDNNSKDKTHSGFGDLDNGVFLKARVSVNQFSSFDPEKDSLRKIKHRDSNNEKGDHNNSAIHLSEGLKGKTTDEKNKINLQNLRESASGPALKTSADKINNNKNEQIAKESSEKQNVKKESNTKKNVGPRQSKGGFEKPEDFRISDKLNVAIVKKPSEKVIKTDLKAVKIQPIEEKNETNIRTSITKKSRSSSKNITEKDKKISADKPKLSVDKQSINKNLITEKNEDELRKNNQSIDLIKKDSKTSELPKKNSEILNKDSKTSELPKKNSEILNKDSKTNELPKKNSEILNKDSKTNELPKKNSEILNKDSKTGELQKKNSEILNKDSKTNELPKKNSEIFNKDTKDSKLSDAKKVEKKLSLLDKLQLNQIKKPGEQKNETIEPPKANKDSISKQTSQFVRNSRDSKGFVVVVPEKQDFIVFEQAENESEKDVSRSIYGKHSRDISNIDVHFVSQESSHNQVSILQGLASEEKFKPIVKSTQNQAKFKNEDEKLQKLKSDAYFDRSLQNQIQKNIISDVDHKMQNLENKNKISRNNLTEGIDRKINDVLSLDENSPQPRNKNIPNKEPLVSNPQVDNKLSKEKPRISEKLNIEKYLPNKTFSNLPPEEVQLALQKKQRESKLKLQSEKLIQKKAIQENKIPHSPEYGKRIEDYIQNTLNQQIYHRIEESNIQSQRLIEKDKERNSRNTELFERLKKRAQEKHKERKNEQFTRYKKKREFLSRAAETHEPFNQIRPVKQNNGDSANEDHKIERRLLASRSPLRKLRREISENTLAPRKKHNFDLSPIDKVDKTFRFNHNHQVFQIPFRKVVENFPVNAKTEVQTPVKGLTRTISVSALPAKNNKNIFDKFDDTLMKYKMQKTDLLEIVTHETPLKNLTDVSSVNQSKRGFNSSKQFNVFFDEIPLAKNLKSVESETIPEFSSAMKKTYQLENAPNELDLSHIHHIDFKNDALPNPVKEFKEHTIFKNERIYIPVSNADPSRLKDFATICQIMLDSNDINGLLEQATKKANSVTGSDIVELNKIIATIFYCTNELEKAKDELLNAVENVKEITDEQSAQRNLGELIFNLAFLEYLIGDIPDCIEMLKNPIVEKRFESELQNIVGNAYLTLNKTKHARYLFHSEIKALLVQEPKLPVILKVYQLINKMLQCFKIEKDKMAPAQFFKELESQLSKISALYSKLDRDATRPYEGILDLIIFRFLHFAKETSNFGLMNYVLEKSIKNKTLSSPDKLSPLHREHLVKYLLEVSEYLKNKPNFGGFEANYNKYLEFAEEVVSSCEVNVISLKLNLSVLFHQAMYLLTKNEDKRARNTFEKCFKYLQDLFETNAQEVFTIIDNLASILAKNQSYENAIFFYEEFLKFKISDATFEDKLNLKIAPLYFQNKQYQKCADILQKYLNKNLFNSEKSDEQGEIMKQVCLFRMATWFSTPSQFNEIQKQIEQRTVFSRNPVLIQYCVLLKIVEGFVSNPGPVSDNAKILVYLESILQNKTTISLEKGSEIIEFVSVIFSKVSKEKLNILHLLKQDMEESASNVNEVCQFIENSLFGIIFSLKTHPEYSNLSKQTLFDLSKSNSIRQEIEQTVYNNWSITDEIENQYISVKVNELKDKIATKIFELNAFQQEKDIKLKSDALTDVQNNVQNILRRSHFNRINCQCSEEEAQKFSPTKLIEQFFRQLKNMMFLDVSEDILTYYNRFESIIKEKNWNWAKFSYVPLLFNFYKQSTLTEEDFDKMKFLKILDEIFRNLNLCVHDLKMVIMLLESFKNVEFLEVFVMYLHKVHPKLAHLIFNWVFLENFDTKFESTISDLYQRIYSFQFYHFENFSLMHFLEFENVLKIEKDLSFRIYRRYRYDLLADERFREVFQQYIDSKTLQLFYFRYTTYKTIVSLFKQPEMNQSDTLRKYQEGLFMHTQNIIVDSVNYKLFIYDFLLLVNFVNLKTHPNAGEFLIEIVNHLKRKVAKQFPYHFAILASYVGNYLFKYKFYKDSVKLKTIAFESLKGVEEEPKNYPEYVLTFDLKSLLFGIISFLFLSFLEIDDNEHALIFLTKILSYDYENDLLNLEKNMLHSLHLIRKEEYAKAKTILDEVRENTKKIELRNKVGDMFSAAIDKLDLMISEKIDSQSVVEQKRKTSRQSLSKFLKPL